MITHSNAWWPTLAVLGVATWTDLQSRRIPNWLSLPFLVVGLVASVGMSGGIGVARSLEGMALGAGLFGLLCAMGGMGMGDVKLFAAIGAWVGPGQLMLALVLTGFAGGLMALIWAIAGGFVGDLFKGSGDLLLGWKDRDKVIPPELTLANPRARKMPYAPAIALGTLISFFAH